MSKVGLRKKANGLEALASHAVVVDQQKEMIGADDAAALLGVHRNTLYRLIRSGELPAFRLARGGRWRFKRQDLLDWIETKQLQAING